MTCPTNGLNGGNNGGFGKGKNLACRCLGCGVVRTITLQQLRGIVRAMEGNDQEHALVLCVECSETARKAGLSDESVGPLTTDDLHRLGRRA